MQAFQIFDEEVRQLKVGLHIEKATFVAFFFARPRFRCHTPVAGQSFPRMSSHDPNG